jgi:site-specific DNA-methyltransferase (adenine-specific)
MAISEVYNEDCMAGMARYPDGYFDLAVVDPPYGMEGNVFVSTGAHALKDGKLSAHLDATHSSGYSLGERPGKDFFDLLFRASKNQVVWGMQYFVDNLKPNPCVIIWDKKIPDGMRFSDAELAWTSFKTKVKIYKNRNPTQGRIHPTQKPVALYDWILKNYAEPGMKILDTHLGSGSSRIAADRAGLDFVGFELDKEYFDASVKRFEQYKAQLKLFA